MKEKDFQAKLIKKLKAIFVGSIVLKNDPNYIQGIPDLSIFYKDKWAMLECKANSKSSLQPNQLYYISYVDSLSFGRVISPENEDNVLKDLKAFMGVV